MSAPGSRAGRQPGLGRAMRMLGGGPGTGSPAELRGPRRIELRATSREGSAPPPGLGVRSSLMLE